MAPETPAPVAASEVKRIISPLLLSVPAPEVIATFPPEDPEVSPALILGFSYTKLVYVWTERKEKEPDL